ncbi:MAG: hypothetical protein AVDCRST_MAG69-1631 [uncultured Solirubrobacteraceae bacterium]|uniref:Uncharacterized protein n=1 Tax=uncultured Solirubrobacteraceae bacterium TaxID=1162706 RepID=A0A6J4SDB6_9ACTN|nr:MAG: hypothetical protein AVDCRST_MAG69-1631 [uncultured Solirubrobacteraceae bacterium]
MTRAEELWAPRGRTPAQLRHARVKVVGSLLLLGLFVVGLAVRITGGVSAADREVPALIAALALVGVHLFSGRMRFLGGIPRSGWLSAFGGIAVAYVFVHLLPELAASQRTIEEEVAGGSLLAFLEDHVYLVALLGLALFYYVEKQSLESRRARREATGEDQAGPGAFRLSIASFAAYNVLIGYLLLRGEFAGLEALALYTLALGVHFVVNDFGLREHHKEGYEHAGRYVLSVAVLVGWLIGLFAEIPEPAIAVIVAFIAGGVVLNVLKEELPGERRARFVPFAVGAAAYAGLLQLV